MKKVPIAVLPPVDAPVSFNGYRFPTGIICHTAWLYYLFPMNLRMVKRCWPHGHRAHVRNGAMPGDEVRHGDHEAESLDGAGAWRHAIRTKWW
ncbi:hypothetical protein Bsp3421_000630 (plasmid) [Burkholderia sp. FERM BP-3421]|uniref:hypothetical protein n=1 Tax=Burkholderia sp. FERM BP-3421 TaxID=1494466 RepID=UPI002361A47E|nr:hypothetical protein [Burkholderia sp. FERM BP-3421]WDD90758.1 hypothetical protein Bsp3421_000630 [Burkholderia sp. FERM BP-3421]